MGSHARDQGATIAIAMEFGQFCPIAKATEFHGQKGYEYFPTAAAKELLPNFVELGDWGMRWTRANLADIDFDVHFLMLYLQRSIQPENIPGNRATIRFEFTDVKEKPHWWVLVNGDIVDICTIDPCRDVDVYFTCTVKCLSDIWMGETSYRKEIRAGNLKLVGLKAFTKDVTSWMSNCMFASSVRGPAREYC